MPTQNNGCDCGVYVLHYLISHACEVEEDPFFDSVMFRRQFYFFLAFVRAYLMTEGAKPDQYDSIIEWTYDHFQHLKAMRNQDIKTSISWKLYQCETDRRKMDVFNT
eukprot:5362035-Ditylum_brightwellii.AAC.1